MRLKTMTKYIAKKPNAQGFIDYTDEENSVWHDLYVDKLKLLKSGLVKNLLMA